MEDEENTSHGGREREIEREMRKRNETIYQVKEEEVLNKVLQSCLKAGKKSLKCLRN